ncbi:MAG: MBL fold metallo-hydrolase [Arenicellales bacterium]|nr:MBL fold metallo-hydrolase [Arenicellales bacterium]
MQTRYFDEAHGVVTIDANYIKPGIASIQLLINKNRAVFFDTGTTRSLPYVQEVLKLKGLNQTDVDFVVPTHVHLDHAGGAGAMMRAFPKAKLIIHPRGAAHMVDPTKLWQSTVAVYGEKVAKKLYGEVIPVEEERIIIADDGMELDFHGTTLKFLDTPGHARHHFCVVVVRHRMIFAGDTMGISYRMFDGPNGPFVFPTTSPVQFDPDALHQSIDRLMDTDPRLVFLTHFGKIEPNHNMVTSLHRRIDSFVSIAQAMFRKGQIERHLERSISDYLVDEAKQHGVPLTEREIRSGLRMDAKLNADGIIVWLTRLDKQTAN